MNSYFLFNEHRERFLSALCTLGILGFLAGCGSPQNYQPRIAQSPVKMSSTGQSGQNNRFDVNDYKIPYINPMHKEFECFPGFNVTPGASYSSGLSGYYSVCEHKTQPLEIFVEPSDSSTESFICAIPVNWSTQDNYQVITHSETGDPLYVCGSIDRKEKGARFSFEGLAGPSDHPLVFNAVFITSKINVVQLGECLVNGLQFCPSQYSYGVFR